MIKIECTQCGQQLKHVCNTDFLKLLKVLRAFKLDFGLHPTIRKAFKETPGYEKDDEHAPFFSERFLYVLLNKEDARTILALIKNLAYAAGIDPDPY